MSVNAGLDPTPVYKVNDMESDTSGAADEALGFADPAFVEAVSGEWFGYECAFSVRDGEPRNIPERYVPDDYRNWGVEIKGFDCLTSSTVLETGSLLLKRTRALPSVGCEADAVVPEVLEQSFISKEDGAVNGGFPDGTISCGPASITDDHAQRWNVCLVDPTDGERSRVRIDFGLVNEPFGAVTVFLEHWDAPFCNGEVLPGCGGKNESFAGDPALDAPAALSGTWAVESMVYTATSDGWKRENRSDVIERSSDDAKHEVNVSLPRGISVGIKSSDDGTKCVAAGWLKADDIRIVSRRVYNASAALVSVSRDVERKKS